MAIILVSYCLRALSATLSLRVQARAGPAGYIVTVSRVTRGCRGPGPAAVIRVIALRAVLYGEYVANFPVNHILMTPL